MVSADKLSKFISLVLCHRPEAAGISLDEHGWADVDDLLEGIVLTGRKIDREKIRRNCGYRCKAALFFQ